MEQILIDANALRKNSKMLYSIHAFMPVEGYTQDQIDNAPTIDPVHAMGVCYCRECSFYTDNMNDDRLRNGYCTQIKNYNFNNKKPTDFCSYGERSEQNA